MNTTTSRLHLCFIGPNDFTRRMSSHARRYTFVKEQPIAISSANPAEAKSHVFTERPNIIIMAMGLSVTLTEAAWVRGFLNQIRERFGSEIYIILAITTPEKFALAGSLFFQDGSSLEPSGLIDNLTIAPPSGIPSIPSLEEQLVNCVTFAIEELRRREEGAMPLPALWDNNWVPVMCDPESRNVWMRWLPRYALYINENPFIVGPTGSGKTRLAAAIHVLSGRTGPFISITPRDFSSSELVQAELFGSSVGAYTGAVEKWGLVKKADKGTLFIDELQSIDRDLQGKLITFIENKTYRRVGDPESYNADVRFVFATNRSLSDLVADGCLRDDFAYRLERLQISLPALTQRRLDISAGACFALAKILRERSQIVVNGRKGGKAAFSKVLLEGFTPDAYRVLFGSSWPGNLRQLENTIAKLIELADIRNLRLIDKECTGGAMKGLLGRTEVTATDVFERAGIDVALTSTTQGFDSLSDCLFGLADSARARALELTGGNAHEAAELISDSPKAMHLFAASQMIE